MAKTSRKTRAKSKTAKPKASAKPVEVAATEKPAAISPAAKTQKAKDKTVVDKPASKKPAYGRLPNVLQLTKQAAKALWSHKKVWIGILLIYGLLNLLLVQDFTVVANVNTLKAQLGLQYGGQTSFNAGLAVFTKLVGTGGTSATGDGAYQFILLIIASLASIWALRQFADGAGTRIRIRDAFYRGMYPLIPFMLILLLVGLQLLPLIIGGTLYGLVNDNGIALGLAEHLLFAAIFVVFAVATLYLMGSSIMALYIVCLPDMTPMIALKTARRLVRRRRWLIIRKMLFLPLLLLLIAAIIMIPLILVWASAAPWVFLILALGALPAAHAYLFSLYRAVVETVPHE